MREIESLMREMKKAQKARKLQYKYDRIQRIVSSEKYLIEVFFHPQTAKRLGANADFCEIYGMKNVQSLFDLRMKHNGGIKTVRVYANGKPFRTINFKGNEIETVEYKPIFLF